MRAHVACLAILAVAACDSPSSPAFDLTRAQALSTLAIAITFSDPPDPADAQVLANYTFEPALVLPGNSTVAGATVTFGTLPQQAVTYRITVTGITRLADGLPLTAATTTFAGRAPFNVMSAVSTSVQSVVVTFDAAPDPTSATTLANYAITDPNALDLSGTPQLGGSAVTLTTSAQSQVSYDVDCTVTRAADHEPLYANSGTFTGMDH